MLEVIAGWNTFSFLQLLGICLKMSALGCITTTIIVFVMLICISLLGIKNGEEKSSTKEKS